MKALNFGSMNLDYVYLVDHFVQAGETISASSQSVKAGGKGLNQSIALARAGAEVWHAGCVGQGGEPLQALLKANGVHDEYLRRVETLQGNAVIQVNKAGENCILLFGGSNQCITEEQISETLSHFSTGDWLVMQNEVNLPDVLVKQAAAKGLKIALNPSPCNEKLHAVDFNKLTWILMNEIESEQLTGSAEPEKAWEILHQKYPRLSVLVTLGEEGSMAWSVQQDSVAACRQEAFPVRAVDTTAAGDTYTGYFLSGLMAELPLRDCMRRAAKAAAIAVTKPGAAESIPTRAQVNAD